MFGLNELVFKAPVIKMLFFFSYFPLFYFDMCVCIWMLDFYINFKIKLKICDSVFLCCSYFYPRNELPHDKTDKVTWLSTQENLSSVFVNNKGANQPNQLLCYLLYEGESISNQHDLFLTGRHSRDFYSVFGHHN